MHDKDMSRNIVAPRNVEAVGISEIDLLDGECLGLRLLDQLKLERKIQCIVCGIVLRHTCGNANTARSCIPLPDAASV
jgi:hypothetical protein